MKPAPRIRFRKRGITPYPWHASCTCTLYAAPLTRFLHNATTMPKPTYLVLSLDHALLAQVTCHTRGPGALVLALHAASPAFEGASRVELLADGRRLVRDAQGAPLCYIARKRKVV